MGLVVLKMDHSESVGHLDQVRVVSIASFVFVFLSQLNYRIFWSAKLSEETIESCKVFFLFIKEKNNKK